MRTDRPILVEAIAFGAFIFLVTNVLVWSLGPWSWVAPATTSQQCVVNVRLSWLEVAASVAVATFAAYAYWRYQRYRLIPADDEPRCENCGYMLRGLPEPRCPECGEPCADDGKG